MIIFLVKASAPVAAQSTSEPTPTWPTDSYVLAQDVYVRGGPGVEYLPVGHLVADDALQPVSRNRAGDWVLIQYHDGFGWIRRDLAFWLEDIDDLPVLDEANLTPSPVPGQETPTPFFPTATPAGNWVNVGPVGAYVRAGPGRTYLRLGQLNTGEVVEPVARNASTTWIMVRFAGGFGWIGRNLVRWSEDLSRLPVADTNNLTPTATFTQSTTPTVTFTPSATLTASATPTTIPTETETATATGTHTPLPPTPTLTSTYTPGATATETWTSTPIPDTATPSATWTALPTDTPSATTAPTETQSPTPALSETARVAAQETRVALAAAATSTPASTDSPTPQPTETPSHTPAAETAVARAPTMTMAATETSAGAVAPLPTEPMPGEEPDTVPGTDATTIPLEAVVGGAALLLVLGYVGVYFRAAAAAERYRGGFVINRCPVCLRGELVVESRPDRLLGIPRARHLVRCTECRSVLRETGVRRWRYAVDPMENTILYGRYNGREVDEDTLRMLDEQPLRNISRPVEPPSFVEDEEA